MSDWPSAEALRHCVNWNVAARNQAERDAHNQFIAVPAHATKRIYSEGKAINVRLTPEEYRQVRASDAKRHQRNVDSVSVRLADR